jgi:DNA-binding transcriptional LysR family regulator
VCSHAVAARIRVPSDLREQTLIEMRGAGDDVWASVFKAHGVGAEHLRILSFEGYFETLTAAERGLGVAVGLFPMTSGWVRDGRLAVPLGVRKSIEGGVYVVFRANDPRHALLTEIAAWLREEYAALNPLPDGRIGATKPRRKA